MSRTIVAAAALLALGLASASHATTPHTLTVDGKLSDFAADEKTAGDPTNDSDYGADNELGALYVSWDASALYLGFDYTAWGAAVLYVIDSGKSGGVTDLCPNRGYSGAFPANLQAGAGLDLLVALWAPADTTSASVAAVHTLAASSSTDITTQSGVTLKHTETIAATQRSGVVELALSWDTIYGLGAGKVPAGAVIKIAGAIRGKNDGDGLGDLSPGAKGLPKGGSCWSSDSNTLASFHTISVDADSDGVPESGWSPGSNVSATDAGVTPADAAVADAAPDTTAADAAPSDAPSADAPPATDGPAPKEGGAPADAGAADSAARDVTYVDAYVEAPRQEEGCACSARADAQAAAMPLLFMLGFALIRGRRRGRR